jgi:HD-like signal output (HDOD) protein
MSQKQAEKYLKHLSDLATISPVAVELISKVEDVNVSRDEIALLVKKDDVLYTNVFKLVNSAALGLPRRVQNILEAINVIGMFQLRSLTFMIAAKKVFVDLELWYKSVFLAYSAEKIALELGLNQNFQSDVYISGLMSSSGQLIFKMFYRDQYKDIEKILNYQERLKAEKKIFGISSIELSCEIIKSYGLPETIYSILSKQSLDWHDEEFGLANAVLELARILTEIDSKDMDEFELRRAIRALLNQEMLKKFHMSDLRLDTNFVAQLHEGTAAFVNANH